LAGLVLRDTTIIQPLSRSRLGPPPRPMAGLILETQGEVR
jgi:hypothetical protein